jgi:hypothetical protein
MKKLVKILVIFTILILLFAIDVPYILSVFSLDKKLKNYIVNSINSESEKVVSIEDMSIGLWTVEANDIKIISSTESSQFVIKNIKFNYNILKLITESSQPQNAVSEIVLVEPKLILRQGSIKSDFKEKIGELSDSLKTNYINKITSFTGINKVLLQNAKIIYKKHSDELLVLADKLNGWLRSRDNFNITLSAEGSIFYGIDNFKLYFDINLEDELIAGRIELVNYNVNNSRFLIKKSDLMINRGNLDGRIYVFANSFDLDSLQFNGYLNIHDLYAINRQSNISEFKAKIVADNNNVIFKECTGLFNNSPFEINAKIENILNPRLTGKIHSERFNLSSLEPYILTNGFNGSNVNLNGSFSVSSLDTSINASISAKQIRYNKKTIKNLDLNFNYQNNNISVNKLNIEYFDYRINSIGKINIKNGKYSYNISADREFGTHLFFDNLTKKTQHAVISLSGNLYDKTVKGNWNYLISGTTDTIININGSITLENELFTFSKTSINEKDFLFSFQLSNIFNTPQINYGYVENIPFHLLTSRAWIKSFFRDFTFEGILVGPFNLLNMELKFFSQKVPESELILTATVSNILKKEKTISGSWEINNFSGNANFKLGEEYLIGKVESGNNIFGELDINLNRENQLQSKIDLANFDIGKIFIDNISDKYGNISGVVNANGNLDNPVVSANLEGNKFVINDIGYYKFDTQLTLTDSILDLTSLKIYLNNSQILNGKANLNLDNNHIDATAEGKKIDADYIFRTIFSENYKINGEAGYEFQMTGSYKSPKISAKIDFQQGDLDNISYDNLHIELSDSIIDNTKYFNYKNHLINIENFSLIKNGQYHFEGKGTFPLYTNGSIDLNLMFTGDLLSLIPHWSNFFVDGASFTSVELKLSGTMEKPRIEKGVAEIEQGELWLADVAEHIDDLSGRIEIIPESNKVNFVNLKAGINGKELVINTVHDVELVSGVKLQPWYFNNINLDFGVLKLSTPSNGIEINIPSLMLENEKGFLSLSGKEQNEYFYFAGPVKHPVVRGSVILSNSRVTFPFPAKKSKEKDSTEEFLENINWDLIVFAGEDLKYERDIDAFLDEVNTELYVNPGGIGLEFNGVINQNTFKANGKLISERGRLDYLDLNFRVESFGVEFNEYNQKPRVTGRAWTVVRDSVGAIPKTIYLELYAIDPETGQKIQSARWEDFRFKLVSADPTVGETQEQVLAYLGYSIDNIQNKATEVGGAVTENYLIRPLLRPIERSLERYLGFDLVRFNSNIAKNLFHVSLGNVSGFNNSKSYLYNLNTNTPYLVLFESSEVTVGKYLSQDLYLTYTGQLVATAINQSNEFNFNHSIGLEYRFLKNILLEFEYDREMLNYFSTFTDKPYYDDFKIRLRHSFSF